MTSGVDVPDVAGPIVAWRYWRIGGDDRLLSLTGGRPEWPVRAAFEATCRFGRIDPREWRYQLVGGFTRRRHAAPAHGCTCGVYAAKDLDHLRGHLLPGLGAAVVGEVSLWGRVVPGTHGFRAQFAYPKSLFVIDIGTSAAAGFVDALEPYGVPVGVIPARLVSFDPVLAARSALRTLRSTAASVAGGVRRNRASSPGPL